MSIKRIRTVLILLLYSIKRFQNLGKIQKGNIYPDKIVNNEIKKSLYKFIENDKHEEK